jgi:hypothetical protein
VSHINDGTSPLSIFLLHFAENITLLVVQTNHYNKDYIGRLDDGPFPEHDITEAKMFMFLQESSSPISLTLEARIGMFCQ